MTQNNPAHIPTHVGLILDGNRRWAKSKGLPKLEGHRNGYENLKTIAKKAIDRGVGYVTAYVFSTENWNRTKGEVKYLMDLALKLFNTDMAELNEEDIRVRVAGGRERLSPKLINAINNTEALTKNNKRGTIILCFNYGGQQEIAESVNKLLKRGVKNITPADISDNLYAPEVPPVDLIIRTSGEQRLSNFMLWRAAYSELIFVKKHWPDFNETDLDAALAEYATRQRRFGK